MNKAVPFVDLFPNSYPECRAVNPELKPNLIGVMIKSVMFDRQEEVLLWRGLLVQAKDINIYTTVHFKGTGIAPAVGFDLDLIHNKDGEEETGELVQETWSKYFVAEPLCICVIHDDIK